MGLRLDQTKSAIRDRRLEAVRADRAEIKQRRNTPLRLNKRTCSVNTAINQYGMRNGDVLLFRAVDIWGRLIAAGGRGEYSHAGMMVMVNDDPHCAEVIEGYGGRLVPLAYYVRQQPGRIDVFGTKAPVYNRQGACDVMKSLVGTRYGWGSLVSVFFRHTLISTLLPLAVDDGLPPRMPYFCSEAVSYAARVPFGGNFDPVLRLADSSTEPCDLPRGQLFTNYIATLV